MDGQRLWHCEEHAYNVGDVVNGLLITEQCRRKAKNGCNHKVYKYRCLECGYECGEYYKNGTRHDEHTISESNLKHGSGCAVCSKNGFVVPGINSIRDLAPHMEKFLVNELDAIKYAPRSSLLLKCKCLDCGKEYTRSCAKINDYGVPCICGDGFSYPEKFISSVLSQLNIEFEPQYYLNNSMYRYDFYLVDFNIILEVHGIQHYQQKWERDEVQNDINKKDFAFSCGFTNDNYIVLDCRESNVDYIRTSLLESKLSKICNFDNVDFTQCAVFATTNLAKTASDLWNRGETIKNIADTLKVHKHTIIAYLKQGNDAGWCAYRPGDGVTRYHQNKK